MDLIDQIKKDIQNNFIMLYMKGTKDMPMCGFSATVVKILNMHNVPFKTINVLGASQQREDHSITNLYLLSTYCDAINLTYVTDYFSITCHEGNRIFSSFKNQIVSILPVKHIKDISTENLKYNLSDEELPISSRGISNQSISDNFTINSSGKIWVFRSHPE